MVVLNSLGCVSISFKKTCSRVEANKMYLGLDNFINFHVAYQFTLYILWSNKDSFLHTSVTSLIWNYETVRPNKKICVFRVTC